MSKKGREGGKEGGGGGGGGAVAYMREAQSRPALPAVDGEE